MGRGEGPGRELTSRLILPYIKQKHAINEAKANQHKAKRTTSRNVIGQMLERRVN